MGVTGDTNFKWGQGVDTWHTYVSISRSKQYAFDGQKKNSESIEYRSHRSGLKGLSFPKSSKQNTSWPFLSSFN